MRRGGGSGATYLLANLHGEKPAAEEPLGGVTGCWGTLPLQLRRVQAARVHERGATTIQGEWATGKRINYK